ncbi:MAG: bile acid:sodium symporter family protein [Eubacterium sp.]|nr:bile acid:sodium symporter family protein [Eubacterium sp.]
MLTKFNAFIEKWMALVTPCCLLVGVLFPEITGRGVPLVPVMFGIMTFIGALKSRFVDVAGVFKRPGPLLLCLLALHVIMPAAASLLGHLLFSDNPQLITGMILEFVVPAAVVGLMWVGIYNGSSPLSLSLVIVDTLFAPFVIPLSLKLLVGSAVSLDVAGMMTELIFMIALPAVAAMAINQISGGKTMERWPKKLAPFSKLCLIFVVSCNASKVAPFIREMNLQRLEVALCILVLAAAGYLLGWLMARLTRQDDAVTVSVIYGSGMRNISAGAVIAAAYFPGEVMFPVMIGTLFQQILAAVFGSLFRIVKEKRDTKKAAD